MLSDNLIIIQNIGKRKNNWTNFITNANGYRRNNQSTIEIRLT